MSKPKPTTKPTTNRATPGTGSIYADKKRPGSYIGQVRLDGRKLTVRAASKMAARDKLNAKITEHRTGTPATTKLPAASSKVTVAQLLTTWLAADIGGRDLAPATVMRHEWACDLWRASIGHIAAADLTVGHVEQGLEQHADLAASTLTKILGTLKQALRFAQRRDIVNRNVAELALIPAGAAKRVPRQALAPADARKLLATLRGTEDGLLHGVSLLVGLRPGEAAALHWSDIDDGVLTVNRSLQRDRRGAVHVSDDLKVESARRSIAMPADLTAWFAEHRRAQTVTTLDGLVFHRGDGLPRTPKKSAAMLAAACEAAGVRVAKPNELRHTCASLLIDDGVAIERVADLLGHSNTRMIDQTYRHRVRPAVDAAEVIAWTAEQ